MEAEDRRSTGTMLVHDNIAFAKSCESCPDQPR
jgi:hypothetical protein